MVYSYGGGCAMSRFDSLLELIEPLEKGIHGRWISDSAHKGLECRSKRDYGQKVNRALSRHFFELLLFSKNHLLKSFLSDFFEGVHIKPWTIFVSRS